MAWLSKGNRQYYYRSERRGMSVRSVYVGGGPVAGLVAQIDANARAQTELQRQHWREFVKRESDVDQQLAELGMQLNELVEAALVTNGYHLNHGEWRRKRMTQLKKRTGDELFDLTNKPNPRPEDLSDFTNWLFQHPDQVERWGNLASLVETLLLKQTMGDSMAAQRATRRHLELMADTLGLATCPAWERPLIQHVCLCWLRLQNAEHAFTGTMKAGVSIREAEFRDTQLTAAQRRYLRAVESLSRVRKLNINVQINLASQQVISNS